MRVLRVWLFVTILAGAVIGLLMVTEVIDLVQTRQLARMAVLAVVVLASAHYSWTVLRGRANPTDHTDKPVP